MRQHLFNMLEDPQTKYVLDTKSGRAAFFNPDPLNGGFLVFNPDLNKSDGHAGTFFNVR